MTEYSQNERLAFLCRTLRAAIERVYQDSQAVVQNQQVSMFDYMGMCLSGYEGICLAKEISTDNNAPPELRDMCITWVGEFEGKLADQTMKAADAICRSVRRATEASDGA